MQQNFDPQLFRQALGSFTTGVTIVTTVDAVGASVGITANSFNSVSLTPPMVLWSLSRASSSLTAFLQAKHFAVHILAADQDALASTFAQRGIDRFADLKFKRGPDGIPLLDGCAARFECRTAFQYEGGDHMIFVGEVLNFEHWDHEPLVFKRGRFVRSAGNSTSSPGDSLLPSAPTGAFEHDFLVYLLGRAYYQLHARIKPEIIRRQLGDAEYFALSLLGIRDDLTIAELDAMVAYTGTRISDAVARRLCELGLVRLDGPSPSSHRLRLTEVGKRNVIELLAVAQAASVDGEESLTPSESQLLRQLLAKIIHASSGVISHRW